MTVNVGGPLPVEGSQSCGGADPAPEGGYPNISPVPQNRSWGRLRAAFQGWHPVFSDSPGGTGHRWRNDAQGVALEFPLRLGHPQSLC